MSAPTPAPWVLAQQLQLGRIRAHAILLQGPSGLGQYALGLALVRGWLCEAQAEARAEAGPDCGACASCHAIDVRAHADLAVAMPETLMLEHGWPLSQKAQEAIDGKERKPSREIRVDSVRDAVGLVQRTSARGRGKAVLVYPAERMNAVTANALLKTLEEPSGSTRLVLVAESAGQLPATIRSRCVVHNMQWPGHDEAVGWLLAQGMAAADAPVLLRAAGGRPEQALALAAEGINARAWAAWPQAVARGDASVSAQWTAPRLLDCMLKLCHDLMATQVGAAPRFFQAEHLPAARRLASLAGWSRELHAQARHAEHPFFPGLLAEAWIVRARRALG